MSSSESQEKSKSSDHILVRNRVIQFALPGVITSVVLLVLRYFGSHGAASAVYDLWTHAWKVHPVLWALAGSVATGAVVLQGAHISKDIDRGAALPLLHFLAHVFSFSAVAVLVLGATQHAPWGKNACGEWAGLISLSLVYAIMAGITVAGMYIVERRDAARKAGKEAAPEATEIQLRVYLIMTLLFLAMLYLACHERGKTEEVVSRLLWVPIQLACGRDAM